MSVEQLNQRMDSLERAIQQGFHETVEELRLSREQQQDVMPRASAQEMLREQASINRDIVRTLCRALLAVVVWFTGIQPHLGELGAGVSRFASSLGSERTAEAQQKP